MTSPDPLSEKPRLPSPDKPTSPLSVVSVLQVPPPPRPLRRNGTIFGLVFWQLLLAGLLSSAALTHSRFAMLSLDSAGRAEAYVVTWVKGEGTYQYEVEGQWYESSGPITPDTPSKIPVTIPIRYDPELPECSLPESRLMLPPDRAYLKIVLLFLPTLFFVFRGLVWLPGMSRRAALAAEHGHAVLGTVMSVQQMPSGLALILGVVVLGGGIGLSVAVNNSMPDFYILLALPVLGWLAGKSATVAYTAPDGRLMEVTHRNGVLDTVEPGQPYWLLGNPSDPDSMEPLEWVAGYWAVRNFQKG